jgi:hypothetical protein
VFDPLEIEELEHLPATPNLPKTGPGLNGIALSRPTIFTFKMFADGFAFFGCLIAALGILLAISRHMDSSLRKQQPKGH